MDNDPIHTINLQFKESEIKPYLPIDITIEQVISRLKKEYKDNKFEDIMWSIQEIEENR